MPVVAMVSMTEDWEMMNTTTGGIIISSATGIDIMKVIETGIRPIINTGIAHKDYGVGQIGAGLVNPPEGCFTKAIAACAEAWG